MLPRGPHQANDCQTLSLFHLFWLLLMPAIHRGTGPDLRAHFDTVRQWIINSGGSHKTSASSNHDPSTMINQNAIINAPASHKMSPNSPSRKAQKAPCRHATLTHTKAETIRAYTFVSSGLYYQLRMVWEKKALPSPLHYSNYTWTCITGRRVTYAESSPYY